MQYVVNTKFMFSLCFHRFLDLLAAPIVFCTCFLVCFQCLLYGFLLDRILHVFSHANLQVSRLNNETIDFPTVLSIKVGLLLIAI